MKTKLTTKLKNKRKLELVKPLEGKTNSRERHKISEKKDVVSE